MAIVRLLALLALTFYAFSMGQIPPSGLNGFGKFVASLFFILAPAMYSLPTIEGWLSKKPNLVQIGALNLLAGWTFIGWVVAYVWALKAEPSQAAPAAFVEPPQPMDAYLLDGGLTHAKAPGPAAAPAVDTKKCPFCAEEILAAAIKCKHCKSDLNTAP